MRLDGAHDHEAVCSAYTTMVYEQEFGSSLVKDVFGRIDLAGPSGTGEVTPEYVSERLTKAYGRALPKAVQTAISRAFPDRVTTELDFTSDNWEAYLRAAWAMCRTASDDVQPFRDWLRSLGPVNLNEVSGQVISECGRGLFRAPDEGEQEG